ncbi:MAG: hypothetical protein ACYS8Z_17400, partial [Planctomycetota bacterium]
MQNLEHNGQSTDIEHMLEKIARLAKWTVIFVVAGMLELIIVALPLASDAGIFHGDGEGIAVFLLIESFFLILVLAPVLALVALNVASKAVEAVSKSTDPSAAASRLSPAISYLCVAGIVFAIKGIVVTLFAQNSVVLFFCFESVLKVLMAILVVVGLFLAVASRALAKTFGAATKLPRRTIILVGVLGVIWLIAAFQSPIVNVAGRIQFTTRTRTFDLPATTKTFDGESSDLEGTIIIPTLDTPTGPGKNVIWCSSFQLAWNEMRNFLGGEPLQVLGAEVLTARLNNAPQSSADLEKGSYFIAAGAVQNGIVERIHSELRSRFSTAPPPEFELERLNPAGYLAYAYLTANVRFEIPFRENKDEFIFEDSRGEKTPVKSFGIWDAHT